MRGKELKEWRKRNGYANQKALQLELDIKSRTTISNWENSEEKLPRTVELALIALEKLPELKTASGKGLSLNQIRSQRKTGKAISADKGNYAPLKHKQ